MLNNRGLKLLLVVLILSTSLCASTISVDQYKDKVLGGWLGQMIGNIFGLPTEGHFITAMGPTNLTYYQSIPNSAFADDDTFNDLVWLFALEKYGLDLTSLDLAEEWKIQLPAGSMACANWKARLNIEEGIMPPLSGHPSYNEYNLYIDAQIEADIWGLISPGMPDVGTDYASLMGELMAYSDGEYGGRFIAALYSLAFIEDDIPTMINKALEFIPKESRYYEVIQAAIKAWETYPDSYRRARSEVYRNYYKAGQTPSSGWVIADVNGAMVVLALLYGQGDFDQTLALAVQFGLDNDCNAATAGGILGAFIGAENIPDRWKNPLNNLYFNNVLRQAPSYLLISDIADRTAKIGLANVEKRGGTVDLENNTITLPAYKVVSPEYNEPWSDDKVAGNMLRGWEDGWEMANLGWDMSPGIRPVYEGRTNVFSSHPLDQKSPFYFYRTETLPADKITVLKTGVTSFNGDAHPTHFEADWELRVYVNDELIFSKIIERIDKKIVWYDLEVSLAEYAGQTVTIRVENYPNNWSFEAGYWDYLRLEQID